MRQELQRKLFKRYPVFFSLARKKSGRSPIGAKGVECGDGWYKLIDRLCSKIIKVNPKIVVVQLKEKFSTLRCYTKPHLEADLETWEALKEATVESSNTCEECGKPGTLHDLGGYVATLCTACFQDSLKPEENS